MVTGAPQFGLLFGEKRIDRYNTKKMLCGRMKTKIIKMKRPQGNTSQIKPQTEFNISDTVW